MPCLRHNSTTGMPASPSLSTATIWLSVNLLFFKGVSDGKEAPKFYRLTSTLRGILRKYGGMDVSLMSGTKELEAKNARLRKMYVEEKLKAEIVTEALEKKW